MQRLIIHLKKVEPVTIMVKQRVKNNFIKQGPIWETVEKKKIFNTLNLPFTTEREKMHHLSMHSRNIKSYKTSYYK